MNNNNNQKAPIINNEKKEHRNEAENQATRKKELEERSGRIRYLQTSIPFLKTQLETGQRILAFILPYKDFEHFPSVMGHKATYTYAPFTSGEKEEFKKALETQSKELAVLKAKELADQALGRDTKLNDNQEEESKK